MNALAAPTNVAIFLDGLACGKGIKVVGRPQFIQAPAPTPSGQVIYRLSHGYGSNGVAALFYKEEK